MIQIRKRVFETNSSSTHSLTMCSDDEYKNFKESKLGFNGYELVPMSKILEDWPNADPKDLALTTDGEYYSYGDDWGGEYLESFDESYTLPDGQVVHAIGYYGYD